MGKHKKHHKHKQNKQKHLQVERDDFDNITQDTPSPPPLYNAFKDRDEFVCELRTQIAKLLLINGKLEKELQDARDTLIYAWGRYHND